MRSRIVVATCLAALLAAGAALAGGTVEEVTFYSNALGEERAALVYLPEGYDASDASYPVLYLIPGHAGTAGNWYSFPEFTSALDQMIGDGSIEPFIFVEPDASCMPWAPAVPYPFPSYLTDSELTGNHEAGMVQDLVGWIDTTYMTLDDREYRYIVGRSAGGYGAARVALRHPDVFGGLGLQAGMTALEPVQYFIPMLLAEYPEGPPYDFNPFAGGASFMVFSWSAAFTPNLSNPPWYVDLMVDSEGSFDTEVWNRFVSESPTQLAAEMAASGGQLDIYMDSGDQDLYQPFTTVFSMVLNALEIPHTFEIYDGDHETPPMWERLRIHVTYFMPMPATAESTTFVFNPRRKWPTQEFLIELPGSLEADLIDFDTIAITEIEGVPLEAPLEPIGTYEISDLNGNGLTDLTVRFAAQPLANAIGVAGVDPPSKVRLTLRGKTVDQLFWEGVATLFVPTLGK